MKKYVLAWLLIENILWLEKVIWMTSIFPGGNALKASNITNKQQNESAELMEKISKGKMINTSIFSIHIGVSLFRGKIITMI